MNIYHAGAKNCIRSDGEINKMAPVRLSQLMLSGLLSTYSVNNDFAWSYNS